MKSLRLIISYFLCHFSAFKKAGWPTRSIVIRNFELDCSILHDNSSTDRVGRSFMLTMTSSGLSPACWAGEPAAIDMICVPRTSPYRKLPIKTLPTLAPDSVPASMPRETISGSTTVSCDSRDTDLPVPSANRIMGILEPNGAAAVRVANSDASRTGFPIALTTMSPRFILAPSADEPGNTFFTMAPRSVPPHLSTMSSERSSTRSPVEPRLTRPASMSSRMIPMAILLGMANPIPTF